jgi:uncharacterized membrane protein YgcG
MVFSLLYSGRKGAAFALLAALGMLLPLLLSMLGRAGSPNASGGGGGGGGPFRGGSSGGGGATGRW